MNISCQPDVAFKIKNLGLLIYNFCSSLTITLRIHCNELLLFWHLKRTLQNVIHSKVRACSEKPTLNRRIFKCPAKVSEPTNNFLSSVNWNLVHTYSKSAMCTNLHTVVWYSIDGFSQQAHVAIRQIEVRHVHAVDGRTGSNQKSDGRNGILDSVRMLRHVGIVESLVDREIIKQVGQTSQILRLVHGLHAKRRQFERRHVRVFHDILQNWFHQRYLYPAFVATLMHQAERHTPCETRTRKFVDASF